MDGEVNVCQRGEEFGIEIQSKIRMKRKKLIAND